MENSNQLATRLKDVLIDGHWIANTNYQELLEDLTLEEAQKTIGPHNSIALLTYHVNYYLAGLLHAFTTGRLEIRDKYSFDLPTLTSETDWQQLNAEINKNAEQFVKAVEAMDSKKLYVHDNETTDHVILPAAEGDPLETFLSGLDELDGAIPAEDGSWRHVRFESRLQRPSPTHSWMLVLAECLFFSLFCLHFVEPATGSVPSAFPERSLVLNVGYHANADALDLKHPFLFYAGEQFPIGECLPVIKREWRLYGDLGLDPESILIVIRADHRCPQGEIADLMQLVHDVGFRKIRLRAKTDPNSTSD